MHGGTLALPFCDTVTLACDSFKESEISKDILRSPTLVKRMQQNDLARPHTQVNCPRRAQSQLIKFSMLVEHGLA